MKLVLTREKPKPDCTLGVLEVFDDVGKVLTLVTMERPWIPDSDVGDLGGVKGKSCVPLGTYKLVKHDSPKHPRTWALVNHNLDVVHYEGDDKDPDEDRATCLLHKANYPDQIEGCIAPGRYTAHAQAPRTGYMVCESGKAMDMLRAVLPWTDDHTLTITEAT